MVNMIISAAICGATAGAAGCWFEVADSIVVSAVVAYCPSNEGK
jgi:hypothetical protein